MYLYVKLNWGAKQNGSTEGCSKLKIPETSSEEIGLNIRTLANRFLPAENKDCMNSASNMSARRGAQFVSMGMPIICWKTFPAKTTSFLQ